MMSAGLNLEQCNYPIVSRQGSRIRSLCRALVRKVAADTPQPGAPLSSPILVSSLVPAVAQSCQARAETFTSLAANRRSGAALFKLRPLKLPL